MIQDTERFKMDLVGGMFLEGPHATLRLYANTCFFSVGANTQWSVDGLMPWQTKYHVSADSLFLRRQSEAKCVIHGYHYSEKRRQC